MGQYYCAALRGKNAKKWKSYFPGNVNESDRLTCHSFIDNPFVMGIEYLLHRKPMRVIWEGDYDEEVNELKSGNLYKEPEGNVSVRKMMEMMHGGAINFYPILYNKTKNEFVDLRKCSTGENSHIFHPLPLLCASSSNGDGGGDYFYKADIELIGVWRYDFIETLTEVEFDRLKRIRNPKELNPLFGDHEGK